MISQSRILHQFKMGENPFERFIDIARSLGYPMFEWNGIVYRVPVQGQGFSLVLDKIGEYEILLGERSPVYTR